MPCCFTYFCFLSLSLSLPHTYRVYSEVFRNIHIHFHESAKALRSIPTEYFLTYFSSLKFYKVCMVGVKVIVTVPLLTPKSNFFCLVYLDFSVCFIVKQPTRVVVHKTAFESWEHTLESRLCLLTFGSWLKNRVQVMKSWQC